MTGLEGWLRDLSQEVVRKNKGTGRALVPFDQGVLLAKNACTSTVSILEDAFLMIPSFQESTSISHGFCPLGQYLAAPTASCIPPFLSISIATWR